VREETLLAKQNVLALLQDQLFHQHHLEIEVKEVQLLLLKKKKQH